MKNTRKHILLSFAVLMMTMTACGQVNDDKTESRKSSASSNVDSSSSESDSSKSDSKTTTTTTASKATSSVTTTSIVTVTDAKGNLLSKISIDENGKVITLDKDGKPKTTTTTKKTTNKTGSTSSGGTASTTRKTTSGGGSSTSYTSNSGNNNSGGYSNGNSGSYDNSYSNDNNNSGNSGNSNSGNSGNNNSSSNNNQQQQTEQQTQAPEPEPQKEYYDVCGFLLDNWCPENYGLAGAKIVGGSYDMDKCYDVACELYEKYKSDYEKGLKEINKIRSNAGSAPITLNKDLCIIATMRSLEQDFITGIGHDRPTGMGNWELRELYFKETDPYRNYAEGECCASCLYTVESAVDAWRNSSSGHYEIMISDEYTQCGLGFSNYFGVGYWTLEMLDNGD